MKAIIPILTAVVFISACEKTKPDYSISEYSGRVISSTTKLPLIGVDVSIFYYHWVTGDPSTWFIPYWAKKDVAVTKTNSLGYFKLIDGDKDDRADSIYFRMQGYEDVTFQLNEEICGDYTIDLFPSGWLGLYLTMPYFSGCNLSYSLESSSPVIYTEFKTKSKYTASGHCNSPGIQLISIPGCEYKLTVNYQTRSGSARISVIPDEKVYYKVEFNDDLIRFSKLDLARLSLPSVITLPASEIGQKSAKVGYEVVSDEENWVFINSRGVVWGRAENPSVELNDGMTVVWDKTDMQNFYLPDLECGTIYYVRGFINTISGVVYGNEEVFSTLPPTLPEISTYKGFNLTRKSADFGALVINDICSDITSSGFCWSEYPNPTILDNRIIKEGSGFLFHHMTGLISNHTYYIKPYATNIVGTAYGDELSFTVPADSISDIEGNVYDIVKIGNQWWMAENLKTCHFNNGQLIPDLVLLNSTIGYDHPDTATCYPPGGSFSNIASWGNQYNWLAAKSSSQLCPTGWHIPTYAEWSELVDYLGGNTEAYVKMIEAWSNGNPPGHPSLPVNISGFTAKEVETFVQYSPPIRVHAGFWATNDSSSYARSFIIDGLSAKVNLRHIDKKNFLSVRCIKDH